MSYIVQPLTLKWRCCDVGDCLVRLTGSGLPHKGRLEVLNNGTWGTVSDQYTDPYYLIQRNGFRANEARVFCYQLGFG